MPILINTLIGQCAEVLSENDDFRDKKGSIEKIAKYLGVTDFNVWDVIEEISIPRTIERRRKKFQEAGVPFWEIICYRKGESKSWKEELSADTLKLYKEKYPELHV